MGNRQPNSVHQVADVESRPTTEGSSVVLFDERDRIKGLTRLITAESKKKKQVRKDQYDFNKVVFVFIVDLFTLLQIKVVIWNIFYFIFLQENMQLLKHMFKRMDPTVMMNSAERPNGEIQLSFKLDAAGETLLVKVIKARDLVAKDLRGKAADPYVKVSIKTSKGLWETCDEL